jgi:hypothetical protein
LKRRIVVEKVVWFFREYERRAYGAHHGDSGPRRVCESAAFLGGKGAQGLKPSSF